MRTLLLGAIPAVILAALSGCVPQAPANQAPQLTALTAASTEVAPGGQTTVAATASDPDGDALTYDWDGGGGAITGSGATVTWTAPAAVGTYTVTCTVRDPAGESDTGQVQVVVATQTVNHAPVVTAVTPASSQLLAGGQTVVAAIATDPDGNPLTYTWDDGGGTITGTGQSVTWTAPALPGLYTVTCTVQDGLGGSDSGDTQIEVVPHPSRIAFVTNRDGRDQVSTMRPDGTEVTNVSDSATADTFPSWAPDGAMILFARLVVTNAANTDIYVTNVTGDTQGAVVTGQSNDTEPCYLPPHGGFYDQIAFVSDTPGDHEVFVAEQDGTNPLNFTQNPADDINPASCPATERIAFTSDRAEPGVNYDVYRQLGVGGAAENLTNSPGGDFAPAWSPDATRIAFASDRDGNLNIYVMNADGTGQTRLTDDPADDTHPTWSPDGDKIAFASNRAGATWAIYTMDPDSSNQAKVSQGSDDERDPAWGLGL